MLQVIVCLVLSLQSRAGLNEASFSISRGSSNSQAAFLTLDGQFGSDSTEDSALEWGTAISTGSTEVTNSVTRRAVQERSWTALAALSKRFWDDYLVSASLQTSRISEEALQADGGQISVSQTLRIQEGGEDYLYWRNKLSLSSQRYVQSQNSGAKADTKLNQASSALSSKLKPLRWVAGRLAHRTYHYDQGLPALYSRIVSNETAAATTAGYASIVSSLRKSSSTAEISLFPAPSFELLASITKSPSAYDESTTTDVAFQGFYGHFPFEYWIGLNRSSISGIDGVTSTWEAGLVWIFD